MKTICVVAFVFVLSFTAAAQDRREAREARREQRRIERAVRDSLRMLEFENDSVNIGYGYIRKKSLTTSVSGVDVKDDEIATYSDISKDIAIIRKSIINFTILCRFIILSPCKS